MKKLLLTILFCLIPCVLFAGGGFTAIMAGGGASGAAVCANSCTGNYGNTFTDGDDELIAANWSYITKIALTGSCARTNPTINGYLKDNETVQHFKFVIYDDNGEGGEPGTLLYASPEIESINGVQWFTHNSTITCLSSTNGSVYVGIITEGSITSQYKASTTVSRYVNVGSFVPPNPWPLNTDSTSSNGRPFYLSW